MDSKYRIRSRISGLVWLVLGTLGTLAFLYLLNQVMDARLAQKEQTGTKITTAKVQKPKPKTVQPKQPRPQPRKASPSQDLMPQFAENLSGVDFGVGQQDWLNDQALGDATLGEARNLVMTAETVDQAPLAIQTAPLEYPAYARKKGIQGYVTLNILISAAGQVLKTRILESSPEGVFDEVALASIQQWRFQPGRYQGQNVQVWSQQKIRFDLQ